MLRHCHNLIPRHPGTTTADYSRRILHMVIPDGLVITNIPRDPVKLKALLEVLEAKDPDLKWNGGEGWKPTGFTPGGVCWGLYIRNHKLLYTPDITLSFGCEETPMDYADVMNQLRGGYNDG
jgi:hypothetical protein